MAKDKKKLMGKLQEMVTKCAEDLCKFQTELTKSAGYALSWGMQAFESAARKEVFQLALAALMENEIVTVEDLERYAYKEVVLRAVSPTRSTSVTGNLMEQERLSAWTFLMETCRDQFNLL